MTTVVIDTATEKRCTGTCGKIKPLSKFYKRGSGRRRGACKDCDPTYGNHELRELWRDMHRRCENPRRVNYPHYGALGVKVCERWSGKDGFANWLADMGPRPEGRYPSGRAHYTIERINVFGDYEPSNCKWADSQEQAANKRANYVLEPV